MQNYQNTPSNQVIEAQNIVYEALAHIQMQFAQFCQAYQSETEYIQGLNYFQFLLNNVQFKIQKHFIKYPYAQASYPQQPPKQTEKNQTKAPSGKNTINPEEECDSSQNDKDKDIFQSLQLKDTSKDSIETSQNSSQIDSDDINIKQPQENPEEIPENQKDIPKKQNPQTKVIEFSNTTTDQTEIPNQSQEQQEKETEKEKEEEQSLNSKQEICDILVSSLNLYSLPQNEIKNRLQNRQNDSLFTDLNSPQIKIQQNLLKALQMTGINDLSYVQTDVLDMFEQGKHIVYQAQNQSGKTLAYLIGILNRILRNDYEYERKFNEGQFKGGFVSAPQVVIVTANDMLIAQIYKELQQIYMELKKSYIRFYQIFTTNANEIDEQNLKNYNPHIIITTLKKAVLYQQKSILGFQNLSYLVIDECDLIVTNKIFKVYEENQDFYRFWNKICTFSRNKCRLACFAAYFEDKTYQFLDEILHFSKKEVCVEVPINPQISSEIFNLGLCVEEDPPIGKKIPIIQDIVKTKKQTENLVIFCNQKQNADLLYSHLSQIYQNQVQFIRGGGVSYRSEDENKNHLYYELSNFFKSTERHILIATDILQRGIIMSKTSIVIQFDIPQDPISFLHRTGRASRNGTRGVCISLYKPQQENYYIALCQKFQATQYQLRKSKNNSLKFNLNQIRKWLDNNYQNYHLQQQLGN